MATKTRVKTEEEYNKLLGKDEESTPIEKKVTHDASKYFDELKGTKKKDENNPFGKWHKIDDLKETIKSENPRFNVDQVKAEIASSQNKVVTSNTIPLDTIVEPNKEYKTIADKKVDELHKLNNTTSIPVIDTEQPVETDEASDIEIIEAPKDETIVPVITQPVVEDSAIPVDLMGVIDLDNTPSTISSGQPLFKEETPVAEDDLELTQPHDFTQQNEDFLNLIKGDSQPEEVVAPLVEEPVVVEEPQQVVEPEVVTPIVEEPTPVVEPVIEEPTPVVEPVVEEPTTPEVTTNPFDTPSQPVSTNPFDTPTQPLSIDDLFNTGQTEDDTDGEYINNNTGTNLLGDLNDQLGKLETEVKKDDTGKITYPDQTETITTIKQPDTTSDIFANTNQNLFKKEDTNELKNILDEALGTDSKKKNDPSDTIEITSDENETKKKFNPDIIINIALIVMIIVIFYLLYQSFSG